MGIISTAMLALTLIGLGFGAFFGFVRGRNRAILRLILVVASIILAIVFRKVLINSVMAIEIEGKPVKEALISMLNQGDMAFPQSLIDLIFSIIEIFLGIIAYFIAFFALRGITWTIVYPICKIFVKKENYITRKHAKAIKEAENCVKEEVAETTEEQTEVVSDTAEGAEVEEKTEKKKFSFKLPNMYNNPKMKRGTGALIGLVQGVLIVFAVLMPLNGLIVQVNKIATIKMQGEQLIEIPADIGVEEYVNGGLGKTYTAIGGWYFNLLTSAEKINFDDVTDMVTVVGGLADSITTITESMDVLQKEDATTQEKAEALSDAGNKLIEVGASIDSLSDQAKEQVNNMISDVKEMISGGEGSSPEIEEFFNDLSIEDIDIAGMGHALIGASAIMEKQEGEAINQEDIDHIVTGLATNMKIVDMIMGEEETPTLVDNLDEAQKEMFETALAEQELSSEDEQTLRKLLGLTIPNQD